VILRVEPESAVPVYEQLRTQIVNMVTAGTMKPGTQLPTIRQLASDLGLAKGTVSKAYDELLRAGVVVSDGRRGTRVAEEPGLHRTKAEVTRELASAAEQYAVAARQLGVDDHVAVDAASRALSRLGRR
jgi:DNA-binding transcriptional regulator YhcF (GntR family)